MLAKNVLVVSKKLSKRISQAVQLSIGFNVYACCVGSHPQRVKRVPLDKQPRELTPWVPHDRSICLIGIDLNVFNAHSSFQKESSSSGPFFHRNFNPPKQWAINPHKHYLVPTQSPHSTDIGKSLERLNLRLPSRLIHPLFHTLLTDCSLYSRAARCYRVLEWGKTCSVIYGFATQWRSVAAVAFLRPASNFARFALNFANATSGGALCRTGTSHGFAKPLLGKDDSDENQAHLLPGAT